MTDVSHQMVPASSFCFRMLTSTTRSKSMISVSSPRRCGRSRLPQGPRPVLRNPSSDRSTSQCSCRREDQGPLARRDGRKKADGATSQVAGMTTGAEDWIRYLSGFQDWTGCSAEMSKGWNACACAERNRAHMPRSFGPRDETGAMVKTNEGARMTSFSR